MRRGGHGNNVQAPWRRRDDAIPSAVNFGRWWEARRCVQISKLAALSLAISFIIWISRPNSPSGPDLPSIDLQLWNYPGFVFPLYHYYRQFVNDSNELGALGIGRRGRGSIGRRIRGEANPVFNVLGGSRPNHMDIEQFYIELKLGFPPKTFYFHVDTGSRHTWVYCDVPIFISRIDNYGPHGIFVPEAESYVNCTGNTLILCQEILQTGMERCDSDNDYHCLFVAHYADGSYFSGVFVNGSFTVPLQDKSEVDVFGLFGCVVRKELAGTEQLPLITDGLIGLGNCKGTLMDQWVTRNVFSQNVLGVCLAKRVGRSLFFGTAGPVGFISLGIDFNDKFDQNNLVWSKLTNPGNRVPCAYAADLLSITFHDKTLSFSSEFARRPTGIPLLLDTGSDMTYLDPAVYEPLLLTLDAYAMTRGYTSVYDNDRYIDSEQRACWKTSAKQSTRGSPLQDFRPLVFSFKGIPSATKHTPLQILSVRPENYLAWDENRQKLCVNILKDRTAEFPVSNLGADVMREHLFVFDFATQRVRWIPSNCVL